MKQKLITALWIVGYSFLALWASFLIWLVIDTGKINFAVFLRIALGILVLWQVEIPGNETRSTSFFRLMTGAAAPLV